MAAPRILVLGGTGYIGGSVLAALLASPPHGSAIATRTSSAATADTSRAWARQQAHPLDVLVADGRGDDWYAAVAQHAGAADIVVQAATSDDLRLTQAVNAGLQAARQQGRLGGLVHLSGCVVCGYAALMAADLSPPTACRSSSRSPSARTCRPRTLTTPAWPTSRASRTVPHTARSTSSELPRVVLRCSSADHHSRIARAFSAGKLHGAIVCPALVWGQGRGPVSRTSVQLHDMVRKALYNGAGVYAGEGSNVWVNVHVDECTQLIVQLTEKALAAPSKPPQLFETFYFASHPTLHSFKDLATAIGAALHAEQLVASPEARSVP